VEANLYVVTDGDMPTKVFDATDADEDLPCPVLVLLDISLPKRAGTRCRSIFATAAGAGMPKCSCFPHQKLPVTSRCLPA
jgi:hypothetical protein